MQTWRQIMMTTTQVVSVGAYGTLLLSVIAQLHWDATYLAIVKWNQNAFWPFDYYKYNLEIKIKPEWKLNLKYLL